MLECFTFLLGFTVYDLTGDESYGNERIVHAKLIKRHCYSFNNSLVVFLYCRNSSEYISVYAVIFRKTDQYELVFQEARWDYMIFLDIYKPIFGYIMMAPSCKIKTDKILAAIGISYDKLISLAQQYAPCSDNSFSPSQVEFL